VKAKAGRPSPASLTPQHLRNAPHLIDAFTFAPRLRKRAVGVCIPAPIGGGVRKT